MTRSKAKNALIHLLETIPENLLSDSETECEDNVMTDNIMSDSHLGENIN